MPDFAYSFPESKYSDVEGLLVITEDLNATMAFDAHCQGVFPWPQSEVNILWWAPDPRAIIFTNQIHASKSLKKSIRKTPHLKLTLDFLFDEVINQCANVRGESWITPKIMSVYRELHLKGKAHSCELWRDGELIGGLYGICTGSIFCGESMFSLEENASKMVLVGLCRYFQSIGIKILDTQFMTEHLKSMGATEISRDAYEAFLDDNPNRFTGSWQKEISDSLFSIL